MDEALMQRWSPATRERIGQAPVLPGVGLRSDSPTLVEDEELLELTGRRGFPLLGGVAFGYPAARALAPSTVPSKGRGERRLFAWDRWKGALYLDSFGGLGVGLWREYVALMACVDCFDAFWPSLVVRRRRAAQAFWSRLSEQFSLSPSGEHASILRGGDIVVAQPRIFTRTLAALGDVLRFCAREGARAAFDVGAGVAVRELPELSVPTAAPLYTDESPFSSRRVWVADDQVIQGDFVLGQAVARLDIVRAETTQHRSRAPALGSPRLERYLEDQGAVCVAAPSVSAPSTLVDSIRGLVAGACVVMRREHEMPDGALWLGLLPREMLPERALALLDFEGGAESFPTGLRLVHWPLWSWKDMELVAVGAWHDWKLILWSGERGLWVYANMPEQMDFVAGELRTWLEILAVEDGLAEAERLRVELAFPLGAHLQRGLIAERLGLRPVPECTDRLVSSYEGEDLWVRELIAPLGSSFCVVRCDTSEQALLLIENVREVMRLEAVAISAWSESRTQLSQTLAREGIRTISSNRQWWSDFNDSDVLDS
ncbi:hypothetical protein WME98_20195 [Sorangium sp. So ce296]|uniref:hypothetical protein n=1 Tax=Sorangium sp. So ce296 TaxID=3133296 RepID=UPI003F621D9F